MIQADIKKLFPIFSHIPDLVYLDSTATSLKPHAVIDAEQAYYKTYSANIFRGVYKISEKATKAYESCRETVSKFIHANSPEEIIFTRNTTESINLVTYTWGRQNIESGNEIVTTIMEHHSNFVPWQQLALENDGILKVLNLNQAGELDIVKRNEITSNQNLEIDFQGIISKKTKLLAITHISNVLGTINPIKEIIIAAKKINPNLIVLVDGAQAVPHMKIDVQDLGCDFYVFSSHKMMGPTGVGVLWGKKHLLQSMPPFLYGGEMIKDVRLEETIFADIPHKYEAGTPHIAGVIGLHAAIAFLDQIGMDVIQKYENNLSQLCFEQLTHRFGKLIQIYGPLNNRAGIIAFRFGNYHAHDVAQILDEKSICVRAGHHCAMPLHQFLDVTATVRASFYIYNTESDISQLINGLLRVQKILK